ncbi:MAG: EscU/YscU/HrcU family type III secretion system export apparatus switch protein [Pseudomonadota bacterium]
MSSEAKTQKASKRKLKKQREKGSVSKAPNLSLFMGQALALGVLIGMAQITISVFQVGLDNAFAVMTQPVDAVFVEVVEDSLTSFVTVAGPIFATVMITAVLIKLIYQGGFLFSTEPLVPKLEKISPAKGFKRMFGKRGWVELGVSLVRLAVWGGVFYGIMFGFYYQFLGAVICGTSCLIDTAFRAIQTLFFALCVLFIVFAVFEGLVQRSLFADDQKMTKSEVKREQKDQHGSKEVRRERKRFSKYLQEAAGSTGVDKTTFAIFHEDMVVGILYDPDTEPVPKLCAKARTPQASSEMRAQMRDMGLREVDSAEVVLGLINCSPGEYVPPELHPALIEAIERMYGI